MSYYRWSIGSDISLFLELAKGNGTGLTGSDPQVMIRRYRTVDSNTLLDNYYWTGTAFSATPTSHSMSEVDATNNPGLYVYHFSQSLIQSSSIYNVYYKHNSSPLGMMTERHYFVLSGSDGDIKVYESEID
jgi:hypothetical protein